MSIRIQKVEELLAQQVSQLLQENLSEEFGIVSITNVKVTADLKNAKIYIATVQKDKEQAILKAIEAKISEFQKYLGKNLKMRYTPRLSFYIDESADKVDRVEELLKRLNPDNVGVARPRPGHREIDQQD